MRGAGIGRYTTNILIGFFNIGIDHKLLKRTQQELDLYEVSTQIGSFVSLRSQKLLNRASIPDESK